LHWLDPVRKKTSPCSATPSRSSRPPRGCWAAWAQRSWPRGAPERHCKVAQRSQMRPTLHASSGRAVGRRTRSASHARPVDGAPQLGSARSSTLLSQLQGVRKTGKVKLGFSFDSGGWLILFPARASSAIRLTSTVQINPTPQWACGAACTNALERPRLM
jgi:hypothetical protein